MTTERCQNCGRNLTPEQIKNVNRCCSPACARAYKAAQPKPCAQCGAPIPTRTKGRRFCNQACAKAYRRHEPKPTAQTLTPAPVAPQKPAAASGDVLGREGFVIYTVGLLNTRLYVFDGPRAYCPLGAWPTSPAGRRLAKQGERSVFDEVKVPSVWRAWVAREVE